MVLSPTAKGMLADAVPDVTAVPLTVMDPCGLFNVGVSEIELVVPLTVAV